MGSLKIKTMDSSLDIEIGSIDLDNEVCFEFYNNYHGEYNGAFINKEQAEQIIEHLKNEFQL